MSAEYKLASLIASTARGSSLVTVGKQRVSERTSLTDPGFL